MASTPLKNRQRSARRRIRNLALATTLGVGTWAAHEAVAHAAPSPGGTIKGKGGKFGVGLTLGDHITITGKYFMAPNHALQFGLGTDFWAYGAAFRLGLDYVWHPGVFVRHAAFDFMPYIGLGIGGGVGGYGYGYYNGPGRGRGYCYDGDGDPYYCRRGGVAGTIFFRTPILGLTFHWKKVPMDTFFEMAFQHGVGFRPYYCDPNYDFCPRRAFWWPAADIVIGARYYF